MKLVSMNKTTKEDDKISVLEQVALFLEGYNNASGYNTRLQNVINEIHAIDKNEKQKEIIYVN